METKSDYISLTEVLPNGRATAFFKKPVNLRPLECLKCGRCCTGNHRVYITKDEVCDVAPEHRMKDENGNEMIKFINGRCPYNDPITLKCALYSKTRPAACGNFQRGEDVLCYEELYDKSPTR